MYYRGSFSSGRELLGEKDVSVKIWRKGGGGVDIGLLTDELKTLRALASSGVNVARIMHSGVIDLVYPPVNGAEYRCIVSEASELGYLDQYISNYLTGEHKQSIKMLHFQILYV